MTMQMLFMRGLPGSGKSTLARQIADAQAGHVFSADDFFVGVDGVYRHELTRIREAHEDTRQRIDAVAALRPRLVIIDNTSLRLSDMREYLELAGRHGATVSACSPATPWAWDVAECARRCVHGVPEAVIGKMAQRWERYADEDLQRVADAFQGSASGDGKNPVRTLAEERIEELDRILKQIRGAVELDDSQTRSIAVEIARGELRDWGVRSDRHSWSLRPASEPGPMKWEDRAQVNAWANELLRIERVRLGVAEPQIPPLVIGGRLYP